MEVFKLTSEYIDYVSQIIMNRWDVDKDYSMVEIERWLGTSDKSICYVGVIDGKPMATGVFDTISDVDFSIPCWNTLLWVEPEYRGRGYGNVLTKKRFVYAKENGYETVYLDTVSAKDYHLKFGWEIVREFEKTDELYTIMKYDFFNYENCTHEFIHREYSSQPYGTCMSCGKTLLS